MFGIRSAPCPLLTVVLGLHVLDGVGKAGVALRGVAPWGPLCGIFAVARAPWLLLGAAAPRSPVRLHSGAWQHLEVRRRVEMECNAACGIVSKS